jgi:dTDP-4-dehydrorhamnose 3,5-epimerase-like enzyme
MKDVMPHHALTKSAKLHIAVDRCHYRLWQSNAQAHRERRRQLMEFFCTEKEQDEKIEQHHHTFVQQSNSGHSVVIS